MTEIQSELAGAFFRTRCSRPHEGVPAAMAISLCKLVPAIQT